MGLDLKLKIQVELLNREFASAEEKKEIDKRVSSYMQQINAIGGVK